jgi:hypothetical protein
MTPAPDRFPLGTLLAELEQALSVDHAVVARVLAGETLAAGAEALLAAAVLRGRSDLAPPVIARLEAVAAAVEAEASAGWVARLPASSPRQSPRRRVVCFAGLAGLVDMARGAARAALSERVDAAEESFVLEADDADPQLIEAAQRLASLLAPEHRARSGLGLLTGLAATELPEPTEAELARAREAAWRRVPLVFVARDMALGVLRAALPSASAAGDGLFAGFGARAPVWADSGELDAQPPVRVPLAQPEGAEVNLVLSEGGVTLEWWASSGELPTTCLAASASARVALSEAVPADARARRWRLEGPRGDTHSFVFGWLGGREEKVAFPVASAELSDGQSSRA